VVEVVPVLVLWGCGVMMLAVMLIRFSRLLPFPLCPMARSPSQMAYASVDIIGGPEADICLQ
jgi:hypothetical protein